MFANVNDFRENDFFFFFSSVCLHSRKMLRKIFYIVCLEQRKTKQQQKTHTQNHRNPPKMGTTTASHPNPPRNPPRATSQPTASQTPTEINPKPTPQPTETHCTKPKIKLQINQIPSISTHQQQLNPSPAKP
jgi:hypothetical protein